MKNTIIKNLPLQYTGQVTFLQNQGQEFITELFDTFGFRQDVMSAKDIAEGMPRRFGNFNTRYYKTRAAISYILAEGQLTQEPQMFKYAGRVSFQQQ